MQTGRKGNKQLATQANMNGQRSTAPADLTKREREVFKQVVDSVSSKHFAPHQKILICTYARATVRLEQMSSDDPKFVELARLQYSCATRLRLTPQALADAKVLGRAQYDRQQSPLDEFVEQLQNGGSH
ncbi:hypothetical protein [Bradyrhizobium sp. Arg816]|uniref:hypothetical protein n=1 Tax=Bradyrhizobium sp. Arg816 TaxID=2998491 RepID=UPI00249E80F5|nr:hypothetical protein [Bradyrhizobium sp. Arg816]MDI3562536.1 hypothetical protein [Bradyrhizobium sp. Arg816]